MKKEMVKANTKEKSTALAKPRWNPLGEMNRQVDDLFDSFFTSSWMPSIERFQVPAMPVPKFEVAETDELITVSAELPGIEEKDIDVTLEDNYLTIKGEKKEEHEEKKKYYHLSERSYGTFQRTIALPDAIDSEKLKAEFKKGVLKIEIPKSEKAKARTKKIQITKAEK